MTTHELARQLLAGPDLPVEAKISGRFGEEGDYDAYWGPVSGLLETQNGIVTIMAEIDPED